MDGVHEKLLGYLNDLNGSDLVNWWGLVSSGVGKEFRSRAISFYSLYALGIGRRDLLKLMLSNGLDSNGDLDGLGPPILLSINPISESGFSTVWMLKDLISYGADVNVYNDNRLSPIGVAVAKNALAHLVILLEAGANPWQAISAEEGNAFEYCQKYKKLNALSILREFAECDEVALHY